MAVLQRTRSEEIMLGVALLGLMISSILYGINITQVYKYYKRFPQDRPLLKALVVVVCILEVISVVFVAHASWYYLVAGGSTDFSVWSFNAELALQMVTSLTAESFLAYRVWMLNDRRYVLTFGIMLLAIIHFFSGEVSAVQFFLLKEFANFGRARVPSVTRHATAAMCDTLIAVSLCYFLNRQRTGYKRTNELIDQLIAFFITCGLLTSIVQIICLVVYLVVPQTWLYLALCFVINRLYANTFLCTLNSRRMLQLDDGKVDSAIVPQSGSGRSGYRRSIPAARANTDKPPPQIDVYIFREAATGGRLSLDPQSTSTQDFP